jgi:hypothetical protein
LAKSTQSPPKSKSHAKALRREGTGFNHKQHKGHEEKEKAFLHYPFVFVSLVSFVVQIGLAIATLDFWRDALAIY